MLRGPSCGLDDARAAIHSPSPHSCRDSTTTLAVAGGTSVPLASGSALARQTPSAPQISNLYRVPAPTPGTKSSHTPLAPSERMGCTGVQRLWSPTTRTPRALGAHTANEVPSISPSTLGY